LFNRPGVPNSPGQLVAFRVLATLQVVAVFLLFVVLLPSDHRNSVWYFSQVDRFSQQSCNMHDLDITSVHLDHVTSLGFEVALGLLFASFGVLVVIPFIDGTRAR
jgi:hypothetical protein